MILILLDSCKRIISYDRAKLKKVGDFYALTWLIFAGLITYHLVKMFWREKDDSFQNSYISKIFSNILVLFMIFSNGSTLDLHRNSSMVANYTD